MSAKPTAGHDPGYAKYEYTTVHKQDVKFTFKPNAPRQFVNDLEAAVEEEIGKEPGKYRVAMDDEIKRGTQDMAVFVSLCIDDTRIVMLSVCGWKMAREEPYLVKYSHETTLGQRVSYRFKAGVPEQFLYIMNAMVSHAIGKEPGSYTLNVDYAVTRSSGKSVTVGLWRKRKLEYTITVPGWERVDGKPRSATA